MSLARWQVLGFGFFGILCLFAVAAGVRSEELPAPLWTATGGYERPVFTNDGSRLFAQAGGELIVLDTASGERSTLPVSGQSSGPLVATHQTVVVYESTGAARWLDLKTGLTVREAAVPVGVGHESAVVSRWGADGHGLLRVLNQGAIVGYKSLEATNADAETVIKWEVAWDHPAEWYFQLPAVSPVRDGEIIVSLIDPSGFQATQTLVLEHDLQWGWKMKIKHRYPDLQSAYWWKSGESKFVVGLPDPLLEMKDAQGKLIQAPDRYPRLLVERAVSLNSGGQSQLALYDPPPEDGAFAYSISPGPGDQCIVTFVHHERFCRRQPSKKHQWWSEVCQIVVDPAGKASRIVRPQAAFARGGGERDWRPPFWTLSPDEKMVALAEGDRWKLYRWADIQRPTP